MTPIARWITLIALFAIPFIPLYVSNTLFFPFITGKAFAFRILVEIGFVSYLVLAASDARYRPKFSWVLASFAALVAWMAVANVFGVLPMKAFWSNFERMDGWVTLIHLFALFVMAASVLQVEKLWRRWWFFFVSIASLVCLYGLVQLGGGAQIDQGGVRLTATLGNAIYLGVYLMFSIFGAAWLAINSRGWTRYALIGFIALAVLVLFFTGSRGPLVGLGAGMGAAAVLWLFLSRNEWKGGAALGVKIAGGALLGMVLLAGSLFLLRNEAFVTSSPFLSRAASVFSLENELGVRKTIWGIALQGVAEDPLTGWGQEGFNQIFNKYYEPSLYQQEPWFDRAHNMYIDWLVAGGIPAATLFVALLVLVVVALLRAPELSRAERVFLTSAVIAYAVQALVVFDNLFSYVPFVMLLALAHASQARTVPQINRVPELRGEAAQGGALAVGAVVAAVLVWTVNVPGIQAAHHVVYALSPAPNVKTNLDLFESALADGSFASQEIREQMASFAAQVANEEAVPEELRTTFVSRAVEEMAKEVEASPNDARLRVQYSKALESMDAQEESLTQLDAAIALSPRKQVLHLSRGFKLYELGRLSEAQESFRYAYELDTSFDDVAIASASGLIVSGDVEGAKQLLAETIGTATPDNERIFVAYYQAKRWNELVDVARAGVESSNGAPEKRYRLAQALAAAGRFTEARSEIDATVAANPDTRAMGEALKAQIFVR